MSIVESVLREELERLANNIASYEKILASLPRGSIYIDKDGSSSFAYRKWKENGRIVSQYLGNVEKDEVKAQIKLSKDYKRIKGDLRLAKIEYEKLRKALKHYD